MNHPAQVLPVPGLSGARRNASDGGLANRLLATLRLWVRRHRGRRELRELDDRTLRDIGISRSVADFEGGKPFWLE